MKGSFPFRNEEPENQWEKELFQKLELKPEQIERMIRLMPELKETRSYIR